MHLRKRFLDPLSMEVPTIARVWPWHIKKVNITIISAFTKLIPKNSLVIKPNSLKKQKIEQWLPPCLNREVLNFGGSWFLPSQNDCISYNIPFHEPKHLGGFWRCSFLLWNKNPQFPTVLGNHFQRRSWGYTRGAFFSVLRAEKQLMPRWYMVRGLCDVTIQNIELRVPVQFDFCQSFYYPCKEYCIWSWEIWWNSH